MRVGLATPAAICLWLVIAACTTAAPPETTAPASSATPTAGGSATPTPKPPASGEPSPSASPTPAGPADHRIGIRDVDGAGEFFDRLTGERFVPRGNNLIRLDTYHNAFNPRTYGRADLERQLARMEELGYNVVRVFLDHRVGGLSDGPGGFGLSVAYLDNLADFIGLARDHGLFVILTQDWLPDHRYPIEESVAVSDININYLTESGVAANATYFRDLVSGLIERGAPTEAIWSYQLRNELFMLGNRPPFLSSRGSVTAPNGQTYDMADEGQRRALLEDGIVHWVDTARAAVLEADPTALVSVGFFVPHGPNPVRGGDARIVETREALTRSTADFIDLHGYPGVDLPLPRHLENFGLLGPIAKPVVMGEMGGFVHAYPTSADAARALVSWQAATCDFGFDGWLLWTWDTVGEIWAGVEGEPAIAELLAPVNRPDPCSNEGGEPINLALGQPTRTSNELADQPGAAAVDGVVDTQWNSGDYPRQWIEVDLAQPVRRATIRLVMAQFPAGRTEHRLLGRSEPGADLILLHTFRGVTSGGEVLTFELDLDEPISVIRLDTRESPSWVGWHEIEVLALDAD